jgi:hypothetical protein
MFRTLYLFTASLAAAIAFGHTATAQYNSGPFNFPGPAMLPPASPFGMPAMFAAPPAPAAPMQAPVQAGGKGLEECCEAGFGKKCWFVFGEFLYLRPRNSEVAWAVPIDDATDTDPALSPPIQVGRVGVVDIDAQPGFRFGAGRFIDESSAWEVSYTDFYGNTNDVLTATAPNVLRPLVTHPRTFDAASDYLDGAADYDIQFQLIDASFRSLIAYNCDYQVGYLIGVRYGEMRQRFDAFFAANGTEHVETEINYYGAGIRGGLEGERYSVNRNLFVYGKTYLSLLGGEAKARYEQESSADPDIVDTRWKAGKVVTIYDLELGGGWQNECGTVRLSAGYLFSFWYNVVRTNEWINAVQENNFTDPSDNFEGMLSFDGFVGRVEVRW